MICISHIYNIYKYMIHLYYAFDIVIQPTPTAKFLQGYVGAVTSAVSIAVSPCSSLRWCIPPFTASSHHWVFTFQLRLSEGLILVAVSWTNRWCMFGFKLVVVVLHTYNNTFNVNKEVVRVLQ